MLRMPSSNLGDSRSTEAAAASSVSRAAELKQAAGQPSAAAALAPADTHKDAGTLRLECPLQCH